MYLLILCVLNSWPVIIMFFMLFCSCHLQMAGGGCGTVQSQWCASHSHHVTEGTYSMYFEIPNYTWIIWFYKVAFYQHLCYVVYLYWSRCWVKEIHFRTNRLVFFLLSYIGPALDRTRVQSSNLVCLESGVEAMEWMWFSICMSVHLSLREWRESCTFMKLQCILIILCILCKLCYIMLFGVNLH